MRFAWFVASALVSIGAVTACGSTVLVTDGEGGAGGSADAATSGKSTSAKVTSAASTKASSVSSTNVVVATSVGSSLGYCNDIGVCEGDGMTPWSGCLECAVIGDSTVAIDGGACATAFANCFGDGSDECFGAGEPECCPLWECVYSCDLNNDGVIESGPELDCFCTNDGVQCVMNQLPGTCFGDYPNGLEAAIEWDTCLYQDVCSGSCP